MSAGAGDRAGGDEGGGQHDHFDDEIDEALDVVARVARGGQDAFARDPVARFAVYGSLVRLRGIAERLSPEELQGRLPGFDWRGLVAMRNVVVHRYPDLNDDLVWAGVVEIAAFVPTPRAQAEGSSGDS